MAGANSTIYFVDESSTSLGSASQAPPALGLPCSSGAGSRFRHGVILMTSTPEWLVQSWKDGNNGCHNSWGYWLVITSSYIWFVHLLSPCSDLRITGFLFYFALFFDMMVDDLQSKCLKKDWQELHEFLSKVTSHSYSYILLYKAVTMSCPGSRRADISPLTS